MQPSLHCNIHHALVGFPGAGGNEVLPPAHTSLQVLQAEVSHVGFPRRLRINHGLLVTYQSFSMTDGQSPVVTSADELDWLKPWCRHALEGVASLAQSHCRRADEGERPTVSTAGSAASQFFAPLRAAIETSKRQSASHQPGGLLSLLTVSYN